MLVKRLIRVSVVAAMLWVLGAVPLAHADVNAFTIDSFDADYSLSNADRQGQLHIIEHIDVTFSDYNHGILRAIPDSYKNHRLQLHVISVQSATGAPSEYTTYAQNHNTVLKIGNPSQTVTGQQEYTIDYTLNNVMSFYPDHDELYWDINGDQWAQPTTAVSLHVHLPDGLRLTDHGPLCFAGAANRCSIAVDSDSRQIVADTTAPLEPSQTLTIVAGFHKGYFAPSAWYDTVGEYSHVIAEFAVPFVLLTAVSGVYWLRRGRDPKGRGVIVPQYDAPDKLSPIEVGTLIDFHTDNRDITATIIDLAIRKYLKIIELKKDKTLGRSQDTYALHLLRSDYSSLNAFETQVMNGLFSGQAVGDEVTLIDLKTKLAKTATELRTNISNDLLARGYFRNNPRIAYASSLGGLIGGFVLLVVFVPSFLRLPVGVTSGVVAGALVAVIFLYFSSSRTAKGVEATEHIKGLKLYMEVAEKQRLKMLQSPDAPYAARGTGPSFTVELFEKLLPYAMVLGVEKEWAKQFEHIYQTPPDWYSGNWTTFNLIYFTSALSSGVGSQINSAFSAPSNASGSGFSGGFSGGGGGGGGGVGW